MTTVLPPYPEYKDSGVEWLGEVPAGWEVRRLKQVCSQSALYGANIEAERYAPTGVRFLRTTDIQEDGSLTPEGVFLSPDDVEGYLLDDGDLLLSRSGTIGRAFLFSRQSHGECAYAGYLVRFVPGPELLPSYLFNFTRTTAFDDFLGEAAINSTIANVSGEKYGRMAITLPPAEDQLAIVHYLDHVDARIQRLIAAKERLIELLEEETQAIINHAVTRGLDPDAPMKDSGFDWLGEVPAHWDIAELRRLGSVAGGMTPSMNRLDYWANGTVHWITPKDMKKPRIQGSGVSITEKALQETSIKAIPRGAVALVVRGMILARHVPIALTDVDATVNQDMKIITPDARIDGAYLAAVLRSAQAPLMSMIDEAGHGTKRLPSERWTRLNLPVPPHPEQKAIVDRLEGVRSVADKAIGAARRHIDLLREYRTRLISDVVTGKLDVREAAAKLPGQSTSSTLTTTSAEIVDSAAAISGSTAESETVMTRPLPSLPQSSTPASRTDSTRSRVSGASSLRDSLWSRKTWKGYSGSG